MLKRIKQILGSAHPEHLFNNIPNQNLNKLKFIQEYSYDFLGEHLRLGISTLTSNCFIAEDAQRAEGEQASLGFDLTFGDVLLHKLVQAYYLMNYYYLSTVCSFSSKQIYVF